MAIMGSDNPEKMYIFLKGYCEARGYQNSLNALPFAREVHKGEKRKSGEDYIIHPLGVALYGIDIGIDEDEYIATELLHDTVEDCNANLDNLNVSDEVKRNVMLLTFQKSLLLEKKEALSLYYDKIKESEIATFGKLLDRYNNLTTFMAVFTLPKIKDYVDETKEFIYPLIKEAQARYVDKSKELYVLKNNIYSLVTSAEGMLEFVPEGSSLVRHKKTDES